MKKKKKKRLFSSLLCPIRVVSSAYLRLFIFIPAILIPNCPSFSLAFHMMPSSYRLNMQGDNIQPWYTTFLIWNQSVVPCPVLTVASWPAFQISQEAGRYLGVWGQVGLKKHHCEKFLKRWEYQTILPSEKPVCRIRSNSQNGTWNNRLVPNRKRSTWRLYTVTLLI